MESGHVPDSWGIWEPGGIRGVLGHVIPGAVTLLAISLLVSPWLGLPLSCELATLLWRQYGWLFVLVVVLAAYLAGALQIELLTQLEALANKSMTRFSRECLARTAIKKFDMGKEWERAAREWFPNAPQGGREPTWQLWRLCDYYVLHVDRHAHETYMGRYNAQYVLFANLGISTLTLCVGVSLNGALQAASTASVQASAGAEASLVTVSATLVALAALLAFKANRCRHDFIERVFPIFYAITIAEGQQQRSQKRSRDTEAETRLAARDEVGKRSSKRQ
jgi:hypothetical protein